jgi:hypothetical protein
MKEYSLKPPEKIDGWIINRHIANGCIYSCYREGNPEKEQYAFKLREPHHQQWFQDELGIYQRIESEGGHPSFQNLVDYCEDPQRLYFVIDPLILPHRNFFTLGIQELSQIDPLAFLVEFLVALEFANRVGICLNNFQHQHLFVTDQGTPFFLGLCEENTTDADRPTFNLNNLFKIIDRLLEAAEYRGASKPAVRLKQELLRKMDMELSFEFDVKGLS